MIAKIKLLEISLPEKKMQIHIKYNSILQPLGAFLHLRFACQSFEEMTENKRLIDVFSLF